MAHPHDWRSADPGPGNRSQGLGSYHEDAGADFAFPVKDNQPGLFDTLDALPWRDVPVARAATDRGHGRIETRTIQVMDAPGDLPFPHVSQAYLIERHVTVLDGTPLSDVAALGVTSLDATRAGPAVLPGLVRGQWAIESLHWRATPSTGKISPRSAPAPGRGPWPRYLALGALHLAGRHDTTEATRWASRYMDRLHHPRTPIMVLKRPCWLGPDADRLVFFTRGDRVGQVAATAAV